MGLSFGDITKPFKAATKSVGQVASWAPELAGAIVKEGGKITGINELKRAGQTVQDIGRDDAFRQLAGTAALIAAGYYGGKALSAYNSSLATSEVAGAGGFSEAELTNLGLSEADFAKGGIAGGISKAVKDAMDGAPDAGWTIADKLMVGMLGLSAVSGVAAAAAGNQEVSSTTTTTPTGPGTLPMPGMDKTTGGEKTFKDYLSDFYGVSSGEPGAITPKSVQRRTAEDQAALTDYQQVLLDKLKALDTGRLADTKTAVAPYQDQLSNVLGQSQAGKGYFDPIRLSFGGKPVASFVPKQNRALADQSLGIGRERSEIDTRLIDMGYQSGTNLAGLDYGFRSENLPNKAANTYSDKLGALMQYLNPNTGQASTTTGTVPGVSPFTLALQGINTGVNVYDKLYNPRQGDMNTLLTGYLMGQGGTNI